MKVNVYKNLNKDPNVIDCYIAPIPAHLTKVLNKAILKLKLSGNYWIYHKISFYAIDKNVKDVFTLYETWDTNNDSK